MKNILVLCTGNSCRSQMAHGYLEMLQNGRANIYSAGVEAHGLNPEVVSIMADDGIDITHHTSNLVKEYMDIDFDYVITVCNHAKENCPNIPSKSVKIFHHDFVDPLQIEGTITEKHDGFLKVRDEIKEYCQKFILREKI